MDKSEVYSWRIDPELKGALEDAARSEKTSVARLLERIVAEWLQRELGGEEHEAVQTRLRESAGRYIGAIHGKDPARAGEASQRVRTILARKHARRRSG